MTARPIAVSANAASLGAPSNRRPAPVNEDEARRAKQDDDDELHEAPRIRNRDSDSKTKSKPSYFQAKPEGARWRDFGLGLRFGR